MVRVLRRAGIAIGSFIAAGLVIGILAGGLWSFGALFGATDGPIPRVPGAMTLIATFVLGYLIYRDIIRRELSPGG